VSQRIAVRVAQQIVQRYFSEGIEEGLRLPTEKEMVDDFRVGRTTIREALRLLEARGVIRVRAGRYGGPIVRRPPDEAIGETLTLLLQRERASLRAVLDARLALEPAIARMAAENISDEQVARLDETVRLIMERSEDAEIFAVQNTCFHTVIVQAANSPALKIYLNGLNSIADGTFAGIQYSPGRHRATAEAHQCIIDALRIRDPDAAEAAMHAHIEDIGAYWTRRYPDLVSRPIRWTMDPYPDITAPLQVDTV